MIWFPFREKVVLPSLLKPFKKKRGEKGITGSPLFKPQRTYQDSRLFPGKNSREFFTPNNPDWE
jgi:hypothetical protein